METGSSPEVSISASRLKISYAVFLSAVVSAIYMAKTQFVSEFPFVYAFSPLWFNVIWSIIGIALVFGILFFIWSCIYFIVLNRPYISLYDKRISTPFRSYDFSRSTAIEVSWGGSGSIVIKGGTKDEIIDLSMIDIKNPKSIAALQKMEDLLKI